ncbi:hypothetical protein ATN88_16095 [Enterovibrio coralii]|uniref:Uncharacterized protein n=1 Tax=Enterovibrio coralii TaxID=294935 RepID=A0A135I5S1_9GAMM|nr:hypothetical protein ATN88_16095 [Enterovibrio coralii]
MSQQHYAFTSAIPSKVSFLKHDKTVCQFIDKFDAGILQLLDALLLSLLRYTITLKLAEIDNNRLSTKNIGKNNKLSSPKTSDICLNTTSI